MRLSLKGDEDIESGTLAKVSGDTQAPDGHTGFGQMIIYSNSATIVFSASRMFSCSFGRDSLVGWQEQQLPSLKSKA